MYLNHLSQELKLATKESRGYHIIDDSTIQMI